jgi:hypothetical protein
MWIYFFTFLGAGIYFYRFPEKMLNDIVTFGTWLGFTEFEPVKDKFWVILSVAMMMTIATCCFIAALNVRKTKNFVIPVFISKLTSSCLGAREFIVGEPHGFQYAVIALVDFPLFVIAFIFYVRAARSKATADVEKVALKEVDIS